MRGFRTCLRGRYTLLYIRYRDARSRAHGRATKCPWVYPKGWGWSSFAEFRAWALKNGFSKVNNSPDRKDATKPYVPDNVRWIPGVDNFGRARGRKYHYLSDDALRGPEPPIDDDVPF